MKHFLTLMAVLLIGGAAQAEEKFLGTIVSATGADSINTFVIIPGARLSVQCTAAAYFITDSVTAVTVSNGVNIASGSFFTTKTSPTTTVKQVISSQLSAIVRIAGPAAVTCSVWTRKGDE